MDALCNKLPDADLLCADLRGNISLTSRGHVFAQWLIDNGHKAEFFRSDVAGWGEPPKGTIGGFFAATYDVSKPRQQPKDQPAKKNNSDE